MKSVFLMTIVLMASVGYGAVGDIHDADADSEWSATVNPNGNWSYHTGELFGAGGVAFDDLCVSTTSSGNCGAVNWTSPNPNPWIHVAGGTALPAGCLGADPNEFNGHGPFMIRWTVPAGTSGAIEAGGSITQNYQNGPLPGGRLLRMLIRVNNVQVATVDAVQPPDNTGNPAGFTRVQLVPRPQFNVVAGDTIDYIVDGASDAGNGIATSFSGSFFLKEINPLPVYNLTVTTNPANVTTASPLGTTVQELNQNIPVSASTYFGCQNADGNIVWAFDSWTGPVANPASANTTVNSAGGDIAITANFVNISVCGDACHTPPTMDFDGNCITDVFDFALFAQDWMTCGILNLPAACFQ